jgi:N-ethylmaleimide reductase
MLMRALANLTGTPLQDFQGGVVVHHLRQYYRGNLILSLDVTPLHGEQLLREGLGELIAFGREYIADPDLVDRIRGGGPFNSQRPEGYYGATADGYTDYPTFAHQHAGGNHD